MRYHQSGQNHLKYKTKSSWFAGLFKKKRRIAFSQNGTASKFINKSQKKTYNSKKIVFLALPVILVVWLLLILYLPYFRLTNINYSGLKFITQSEIEELLKTNIFSSKILPSNNYFLIKEKSVEQAIQNKFSINLAVVTKSFPNTLNIEIQEKLSSIIYDNGQKYFLLDQDGQAIKYLMDAEAGDFQIIKTSTDNPSSTIFYPYGSAFTSTTLVHTPNYITINQYYGDYPIVYDQGGSSTTEKQTNVLKPEFIKGIINFYSLAKTNKIIINYFVIDNIITAPYKVTAYTNQPWNILLNPLGDIAGQIKEIKLIQGSTSHPTSYIDVRFSSRVYWK